MANFKGGFAFNNEAAKVEVEQAPDGTLISCVNPVTGESLGGNSDFSTATLTVDVQAGFAVYVPNLYEEDGEIYCDTKIVDDGNYSSVLYNNTAFAYVVDSTGYGATPTITVSGDAVVQGNSIFITGDCSITITA